MKGNQKLEYKWEPMIESWLFWKKGYNSTFVTPKFQFPTFRLALKAAKKHFSLQ
jgi:hypothetical protein